jgi:hypothetical protein
MTDKWMTIRITKKTANQLEKHGKFGNTWNDAIVAILDAVEREAGKK